MKTLKTICITATIIIVLLGWKNQSIKNDYKELKSKVENFELEKSYLIDSLTLNSIQFVNYYCATENLLDSIFVKYPWPDAMDNYSYYESIDNIYTYNEHMYNYMDSLRKKEEYR